MWDGLSKNKKETNMKGVSQVWAAAPGQGACVLTAGAGPGQVGWAQRGHQKADYRVYHWSSALPGFTLVSHSNKVSFIFFHSTEMLIMCLANVTHRARPWTDSGEQWPPALVSLRLCWRRSIPEEDKPSTCSWLEHLRWDLPRAEGGDGRARMSDRTIYIFP